MDTQWQTHARDQVPRYTSYPPATHFKDSADPDTLFDLTADLRPKDPLSLYLHIPFCEQLCWYCGCATSIPNTYDRIATYVEGLHKEIDLWADLLSGYGIVQRIHFGGGSPNSLSCVDFNALVRHLLEAFNTQSDLEIDIELDPRTTDDVFIETLSDCGISRASLGVQTLCAKVQKAINRIQPQKQISQTVAHLRKAGVQKINFDVLYGLPHQTQDDVEQVCNYAAELEIDRVSVFGYAHVPWFAKHQRAIDSDALPGLNARYDQAMQADRTLRSRGYQCIGMDHFALPSDSLSQAKNEHRLRRNFQGYTDDPATALIGIGTSAISRFPSGFSQNAKNRPDWRAALDRAQFPTARNLALSDQDKVHGALIEEIMCYLSVDVSEVCARYNTDVSEFSPALAAVEDLARKGMCELSGTKISIPNEAKPFVRTIAACFDQYRTASHSHAVAV